MRMLWSSQSHNGTTAIIIKCISVWQLEHDIECYGTREQSTFNSTWISEHLFSSGNQNLYIFNVLLISTDELNSLDHGLGLGPVLTRQWALGISLISALLIATPS